MRETINHISGTNLSRDYPADESINVVTLIKKAKLERKKEKRRNIVYFTTGIAFVAAAGLIITL